MALVAFNPRNSCVNGVRLENRQRRERLTGKKAELTALPGKIAALTTSNQKHNVVSGFSVGIKALTAFLSV